MNDIHQDEFTELVIEWEDRASFGFVTTDWCNCDDKWFVSTEDKSSEVAMVLAGAITWFRVAEFTSVSVWTAVVVDVHEIEADDPRDRAEDHRCLLDGKVVDKSFEFSRRDGVNMSERVIVGVRSQSGVGDGLDGLLIDSSLEKRRADNPGVEGVVIGVTITGYDPFR